MKVIANLRFKQDQSIKFISKSVNRPLGAISSTLQSQAKVSRLCSG